MLEGLGVRRWLRRFNGPFGSSVGVALTSQFPEGGSVVVWVRDGRHVVLAYVIRILRDACAARLEPNGLLTGASDERLAAAPTNSYSLSSQPQRQQRRNG